MAKKIIIVDDHKDVVDTISLILKKEGYIIEKAYGGEECLDKLDEHTSAIFLDIMMPKISGYKVAEEARKKYGNKIKIAYVSILPRVEANTESADVYIQKPFEINDIISAVKRMLTISS